MKNLLFVFLLIAGLSLSAQESKPTKVNINPGQTYRIELPSYQNSNQVWFYEPIFDTTLLVFEKQSYEAPKDTLNKKDQGLEVFTFKALKKGEARVRFALKGKWDRKIARVENYWFVIGKN